jgi:hypothetical protein
MNGCVHEGLRVCVGKVNASNKRGHYGLSRFTNIFASSQSSVDTCPLWNASLETFAVVRPPVVMGPPAAPFRLSLCHQL